MYVEDSLFHQKNELFFLPQVLSLVKPTLIETFLNPTWNLYSGTCKDEIERPPRVRVNRKLTPLVHGT
jgi:hypothetical protein